MMTNKYISAMELRDHLIKKGLYHTAVRRALEDLSTDEVVSKELYEQVKWERDTALKQLDELGISLGQKIEREE